VNIRVVVVDEPLRSNRMVRCKVAMHHVRMIAVMFVRHVDMLRRQQCQRQDATRGNDSYEPLQDARDEHGPIIMPKARRLNAGTGRPFPLVLRGLRCSTDSRDRHEQS
jgi:hypothetical protein